jgi:hypothetical protein
MERLSSGVSGGSAIRVSPNTSKMVHLQRARVANPPRQSMARGEATRPLQFPAPAAFIIPP